MKIRSGFVSNSSSSSFVLRGMKTTQRELIDLLKITQEEVLECDGEYEILELIESKLRGKGRYSKNALQEFKSKLNDMESELDLNVEITGNYFGNKDFDNLIVGKYLIGELKDGQVTEIEEDEIFDQVIIQQLNRLGLSGKLRTYAQMISNDNY